MMNPLEPTGLARPDVSLVSGIHVQRAILGQG